MKKILNTKLKDMKAITLIALVITIVVLIILAGVLINISLGNNGLFNKAKTAKEMYTNAQNYEEIEIAKMTNQIDGYVDGYRNGELTDEIKAYINSQIKANSSTTKKFIDTSNLIETVANDADWTSQSCSYTATEDCVITGYLRAYSRGTVDIYINSIFIGSFSAGAGDADNNPILYYLASGDKIDFTCSGNTYKKINVYGIK